MKTRIFLASLPFSQPKFTKRASLLGLLFSLSLAGGAAAAPLVFYYTPKNTSTDVWSSGTNANWSATPVSSLPTQIVIGPAGSYSGVVNNTTTNDIVTTDNGFLVSVLTLRGTGAAGVSDSVTIKSSPGKFLNLDSTIPLGNPQINLDANNGSGGGTLTYTIDSPILLGSVSGGGLPLIITGNGNAQFNITGVVSGTLGLSKSGSSSVTFSGSNSYSGSTSVLGGTLVVGANALSGVNGALGNASSAVLVGDVSGSQAASLLIGGAFTIGRDIQIQAGSTGVVSLGGNTDSDSLFTGNITLNRDTTLQSVTTGARAVTFNTGVISGTGGVIKSGVGTVILGGVNTYTGATTVNQGTLKANVATQAFGVNSAVTLTTSGALDLNSFSNTVGSLSGTGAVILGSGTLTVGGNQTSTSYAGVINGSGGLVKTGTGALTLSGASSYSGVTSLLAGTLQIGASALAGTNGPLGNATSAILVGATSGSNSATLLTTGAFTVGRDINVLAGSTGITTLGGGSDNSSTFTGNITLAKSVTLQSVTTGANSVTFSTGVISGVGFGITKTGSGTLILAGSNTYTGTTTITSGTLVVSGGYAIADTSSVALSSTSAATFQLNASETIGSLSGGTNTSLVTLSSGAVTLTTGADNTAQTYSGVISGAGGLTKIGTAVQTLSRANTYTGATTVNAGSLKAGVATSAFGVNSAVTVSSGTLDLANNSNAIGSLAGSGGVVSLGSGTLTTGSDNSSTSYAGLIQGTGGLTKVGTGVMALTGSNTYTGATTINSGTLALSGGYAIADASAVTFANTAGAVLLLNASETIGSLGGGGANGGNVSLGSNTLTVGGNTAAATYSGVISGAGGITKIGTGSQTFSRANTYTGSTLVSAGTLKAGVVTNAFGVNSAVTVNTGGTLDITGFNNSVGSLAGNGGYVTLGAATLTTGSDNSSTSYAGLIQGTGGLTKVGSGIQSLSGVNTYTGATTINAGTLKAGVAGQAFGLNSTVSLANASGVYLDLAGYNETIGSLAGAGSLGGEVSLGAGTLTLGTLNSSTSYSGIISGSGGVTKLGTGTQTLSGTGTYTGTTLVTAGTFKLASGAKLNSDSSLEFIISGTFSDTPAANDSQTMKLITFTAGDGTVQTTWASSGTNRLIFTDLATRKAGATGNLVETNGTALTNRIEITNGQTAKTLIDKGIFFNGSSYAAYDSAGFVRAFDYTAGTGDTGGLLVSASSTTVGAITAASNVKTSAAIGAQTTGTINTLNIAGNYAFTLATDQILTVNGILKSGGTVGGATISGGAGIQADNNQEMVIRTDVANDSLTISSSIMANGVNALTKSGAGTLTLSGSNSYSGVTTINAGVLQISGSSGLGDGSSTNTITFNGGTLQSTANTYDLGANRSVKLNAPATIQIDAGEMTVSGQVTTGDYGYAASNLTKTGAGTLVLSGSNTYTGSTTVNNGVLKAGIATNAFGNNSAVTLSNVTGVILDLANYNNTIGSLAGGGVNGGNVTLGSGTLTVGGNTNTTTFSGILSGAGGGLTKVGGGTMTVSGSNTYTGATSVNGGSLKAGIATNAFGVNSAVTVNTGGTLDITGFNNSVGSLAGNGGYVTLGAATLTTGSDNSSTSYAGIIQGTGGGLTKVGTGMLTLSGVSTYTGLTTVTSGTLKAGVATKAFGTNANMTLADTAGVVVDITGFNNTIGTLNGGGLSGGNVTLGSATLTLGSATSGTFSGIISGAGGITKTGAGIQTLSGSNTYTGATAVNAGALQAGVAETAFGVKSAVTITTTGTLALNNYNNTIGSLSGTSGFVTLGSATLTTGGLNTSGTFAGAISGAGGFTKVGTGTQTLSGSNSYAGMTTITSGTLAVSGGNAIGDTSAVVLSNTTGAALQVNTSETIGSLSGGGASGGNVTLASSTTTLTTGSDGTNTTYSGNLTGSGGFTKIGLGTQTLDANNTYSGVTTIQSGTLALVTAATSNIGNSATLLVGHNSSASTATLDVTGVSNAGGFHVLNGQTAAGFGIYNAGAGKTITVDAGAHWSPGTSGSTVGVNTVTGNLTLSGISDITLGTPGASHAAPGKSDQTLVSGTLTLGGTLNLVDNAGNGTDGAFGGGSYQIFTQSGTPTSSFSLINNIGTSHAKVDTSTPGVVYLDVFRQASALVSTVNLPSVHVGGVLGSKAVTIINNNPNDGYTEGLNASLGTPTGSLTYSGTAVVNLTGTDTTSYVVSLAGASTNNAGHKSGTVKVTLASNGSNSGYSDTALSAQTLTVNGDVFRLATPNDITQTIDLGYIHQGSTFNDRALTITNGSVNDGFSEGLDVTTGTPTGDAKTTGGPLSNMFGSSSAFSVGVDTTTPGVKNGTALFNFTSNGSFSVLADTALPTQTVTLLGQVYSGQSVWNTNGSGTWSDISKWTAIGGSPGNDSHYQTVDTATFGAALTTSSATVNLNGASPSISAMIFDNATCSYTVAQGTGNGILKLNGGAGNASIADNSGNHTVSAPMELDSTTNVSVGHSADTLVLAGPITGSGGAGITKTGSGNLNISGLATYAGSTTLAVGTLSITGTLSNTASMDVAHGATLKMDGLLASKTTTAGLVMGSGTMGDLSVADGGVVAPGNNGTGILTVGALKLSGSNSTMQYQLGGTQAGVNYNQMRTTGPVGIDSALLDLTMKPDYAPEVGDR